MTTIFEIGLFLILILFCTVGFAAIFFAAGGTLIIFLGALLYAALTGFDIFDLRLLIIFFSLYVFGELMEFFFTAWGAKKFGASSWAVAGSVIGGLFGGLLGATVAGVGAIFGVLLGIFMGAFLTELIVRKDIGKSLKAGTGGVLGHISSVILKAVIAIAIFILMAVRFFSNGLF